MNHEEKKSAAGKLPDPDPPAAEKTSPRTPSGRGRKRPRKVTVFLTALLLIFISVAFIHAAGRARMNAGDYITAEKILRLPAALHYSTAPELLDICETYNHRGELPPASVTGRLHHYTYTFSTSDSYPPGVRGAAEKALQLYSAELYEMALADFHAGDTAAAETKFRLARGHHVPELPDMSYYLALCEAINLNNQFKFTQAFERLTAATALAPSSEAREECRNWEKEFQSRKTAWEPGYLSSLQYRLPFEGLEEEYLPYTMIALSYSCNKETKHIIDNPAHTYNVYRFYDGSHEVFTVLCDDNKVSSVTDKRPTRSKVRHPVPYVGLNLSGDHELYFLGGAHIAGVYTKKCRYTDDYKQTYVVYVDDDYIVMKVEDYLPERKKSSTSQSKTESTSGPYNAKDYAHPEDFYDWYADDFLDYEDAEDYWEKHH